MSEQPDNTDNQPPSLVRKILPIGGALLLFLILITLFYLVDEFLL